MAADDSHRKLKKRKHTKRNIEETSEMKNAQLPESEDNSYNGNKQNKNKKRYSGDNGVAQTVELSNIKDESETLSGGKKKSKKLRTAEKKMNSKVVKTKINKVSALYTNGDEDERSDKKDTSSEAGVLRMKKSRKKNRKNVKTLHVSEVEMLNSEREDGAAQQKNDEEVRETQSEPEDHMTSFRYREADTERNANAGKSKKAQKTKKKAKLLVNKLPQDNSLEKKEEAAENEVYEMSSGDEDSSKGMKSMKKWITEYYQSRPGLEVLQERIDDFIAAHEAQEEQARREREAKAAEGGWTVVVHHKGRKKTLDAETGTVVGSVAPAAVLDKMTKKKNKEAGPDFYRFQRREAHRNEIMMLQSKFQQDKKRIQQLRAERKFRPY